MYKHINAIELAIESAKDPNGVVMKDRQLYVPFFKEAEKYIRENNLIVGGNTATNMLFGKKPGPDDYLYEIYSSNIIKDGIELTKIFYNLDPDGLGHYTHMMTEIPNKELIIKINERQLFHIKALEIHRGARAADIIHPSIRPPNFLRKGLKLQCMGPDIQLINIYASLTNPANASEWSELLEVEEKLRKIYIREVNNRIKSISHKRKKVGGKEGTKNKHIESFIYALAKEYAPRSGHVVIGDFSCTNKNRIGKFPRLQLISSNSFKEEERIVTNIAVRFGLNIQKTINEPKVISDDKLRKMTMYIIRPGMRREPFLDIFNTGEYELIPFINKKITDYTLPIGTPFTIMRFLLIEAWVIQLLFRMDVVTDDYARRVLKKLLDDYKSTVSIYEELKRKKLYDHIFPKNSDKYIGNYMNFIILRKRKKFNPSTTKRKFYPPFYPARKNAAQK